MDRKSLKRVEFLRKTIEKLGLTWELVKSTKFKDWARYEIIFRFYDKILKINSVSISYKDFMNRSSNGLDMKFKFTFKLLAACYNAGYDANDKKLLECIRKKLRQYIKFNSLTYLSYDSYIDSIDFNYMLENLILDGVDLSEFPSIEEVL